MKNTVIFILICAFAVILRVLYLDKVTGLGYDELVIYSQAVLPVVDIVKNGFNSDINFPLYQICLHYWGMLFKYSDVLLRLLSVICGVLTCIAAYFIGNRKQGLVCMLLFAVNSFLIYYSQEVGMYSFLALFSVLNLASLIKIKDENKGYILWTLSSLAMVLTYTISIVYLLFEIIAYLIYKRQTKFIVSGVIFALINVPLIAYLVLNYKKYVNMVSDFHTDYSTIFIAFQNFVTPKLMAFNDNILNYAPAFFNEINFYTLGLVLIPMIIAIFFIEKALRKDKFNLVIFIPAILYVGFQILMFQFFGFNILSKYLIFILPNFLILIAFGFESKVFSILMLVAFLSVNLSYLGYSSNSAFKREREGLKILSITLQKEAKDGDVIVFWNNPNVLDKYVSKDLVKIDLLNDYALQDEKIVTNSADLAKMTIKGRKNFLRTHFISSIHSQNTIFKFSMLYNQIKPEGKLFVVSLPRFEDLTRENYMKNIASDETYKLMTYDDLFIMHSMFDFKELSNDNLTLIKTIKNKDFVVYIYKK